MRISIIGQPASGKSVLAERISTKLGIPYLHLDRLYFEGGGHELRKNDLAGKEMVRAHIRKNVEEFIKQESWVSDGWYSRIQPIITERADRVLLLKIPLYRRFLNHLHRAVFADRHPELNAWDEITFVYDMVKRMFTHEPKIRAFVMEHSEKIVTLRSYKEIDRYVEQL